MKKLTQSVALIIIAIILTINVATAQSNPQNERTQGYYTFGLNGGVAYQQSDVLSNLNGIGFSLTYGKNLIYSPNVPFSIDLRSRFQIARSFGKDIRPSLGIEKNQALNGEKNLDYTTEEAGGLVYANYKNNLVEAGLEGVITLNGLRQTTGLGLSFTGGIGLDWYKTTIDQRDANGLYSEQYKNIDAGGARPYNLSQLNAFRDGDYETTADGFNGIGKLGIMPSLGIELDYDLTDNLALGVGHRITFSGTDILDGQKWTNSNVLTGNNDILHYTSLGLKYSFNQKNKQKTVYPPTIDLIEPYSNDLKTSQPIVFVKAKVNNVSNPFDIYLTINGKEQTFTFNNQTLNSSLKLRPGENQIVISANNKNGNDREKFSLFYEPTEQSPVASEIEDFGTPDIHFTNPSYDGLEVEQAQINIRAKVRHVKNRKSIELRINGRKVKFDFDTGIAALDATIDLKEGKNIIKIKAKNKGGERELTTTVFRQLPMAYPTIKFTKPTYSNAVVERDKASIEIIVENIEQSGDIQLLVNQQNEPNFYFDNKTGQLKATILLREGSNKIEVIATNKRGKAKDQTTITYKRPYAPTARLPRVTINAPNYSQSTTNNKIVVIHATLTNTFRKSAIRLTNNGQRIYNFQFNPNTGSLRHDLYLLPGINQIAIEAQNEAGRDGASATINFELPPLPPPPVVIPMPDVDIIYPQNKEIVEEREIRIKAYLISIAHRREIEFYVNGEDCLDFRFNPENGSFSANVELKEGANTILVKGKNPRGVSREKIVVYYERPHAPIIDFQQPNFNTTENERIQLKANIEYIDDKRDIRIFLNNREIRDFRFRNEQLDATLLLQEGQNEIEIIAENKYGKEERQLEINYYIPKPPNVYFIKPVNKQTVRKEQIRLEATTKNVKDKKAIRLFINGRASGNFDWEEEKLTANINLKEGVNTILLKVKTEHGNDAQEVQINYQQIKLPIIDIVSHNDKEEVGEKNIILKAYLKNVKEKAEISLKINGKNNATFTFKEGTLRSPIRLKKGENIILIQTKTADGEVTKELKITYKSTINSPIVRFITPTKLNKPTQHTSITIKALIKNIKNRRDLQLTVNGKEVESFQFDIENNEILATVFLKTGLNLIKIHAENESGVVEREVSITRKLGRPVVSKKGKKGKIGKSKKIRNER